MFLIIKRLNQIHRDYPCHEDHRKTTTALPAGALFRFQPRHLALAYFPGAHFSALLILLSLVIIQTHEAITRMKSARRR